MKTSTEYTEKRACDEMTALLERVPMVALQHIETEPYGGAIDFAVHVRIVAGGEEYVLGCEVKANGQPRYAETAILKLAEWRSRVSVLSSTIFIAPYISPAVRKMCAERDVGYLDFAGNCLLKFGPVYIERTVAHVPQAEQRELKSIYKPRSARVLRVLLNTIGRGWKVKDLATASGVSLGQVSNVGSALRDRRWISDTSNGIVLTHPDKLLEEWRGLYEIEGNTLDCYTVLHGPLLQNAIRKLMSRVNETGPNVALSSFSAADWTAPYGRTGKTYFYASLQGFEELVAATTLKQVSSGSNVQITIPKDDGVFLYSMEPSPGIICTSPVQTYLDLYASGERGKESAEHLRKEKLKW